MAITINNFHKDITKFSALHNHESNANGEKLIQKHLSAADKSARNQSSSQYINAGNKYMDAGKAKEAIKSYQNALASDTNQLELFLKLGKAYKLNKNYDDAIANISHYLDNVGDNSEAEILLAEIYRLQGKYNEAIKHFEHAIEIDPNDDLPQRSLAQTKNDLLACYDVKKAKEEKNTQAKQCIQQALLMARDYLSPDYLKDIADITVCFGDTAYMSGTQNIAQYENSKKAITITDNYIYAKPNLVCAYLVHEFVHAKDKDAYTSVCEEQDAYRKAAIFWKNNSNGVKDPEMDYVVSLYNESPSRLNERVDEIYTLRDPNISRTSPNHPPASNKSISAKPLTDTASQPLKKYDVIA